MQSSQATGVTSLGYAVGMRLNLSADELLTTTRAVRKRLDLERPVPRELIEECIEIALQAPTGSNMQGWQWIVVDDPDLKSGLAEIYRQTWNVYSQMAPPRYEDGDIRNEQIVRVTESSQYLADHLHEVPVLVIPCIRHRAERLTTGLEQAGIWGSIFPAVWNFQLAARERGLGTVLTTLHLGGDEAAAELLGIDHLRYRQAGLIPVAYTKGSNFRPARRIPIGDVVHWNGMG